MKKFEWDKDKQLANLVKHGIDFIGAQAIFDDTDRIEGEIDRNGEKRYQTIGQVKGIELFVVYTIRGIKTRIISARRASKNERKKYKDAKAKN